ncbi:efflux RND transporter periplasmic adaptor subunit [Paracoccus sp. TK19116]|uniref:Efflux RND transporter periplasmic adaptor subunit n=1 Tax=Paracoccus albicereus TaxID=2922394 RepID=A0ABT1MNM2_9RHOB|nr:efflux RND transporter periplasmic adaptor subunit [Paracoccus albicereus]MCQ0969885.1 efflux RND transporter periplasmic adaptor subunit [Paracoccus albicereus]
MIKRLIIAVVLLVLVVGGLVGFNLFRDKMIADVFANMPVQPSAVSTVTVEPTEWQPGIEAIGTVNAAQGVDLAVESAGIVREINFRSNQRVEQGDVLLQLDDTAQQADVAAARTQFELERSNLDRTTALRDRGVTASSSLENSEAAARAAEAQLARAEAVLDQRQLVAPFSGTVGIARIDLGQYVSPGTPIATLQDLDNMRVDFSLPEQRLNELEIGQTITVRAEGLNEGLTGEITGIDPRVDAASRMVSLQGEIGNADGRLTPGQFVRIEVQLPVEENVIAVPQTALITSLYGDHVYVARPSEDDPEQMVAAQIFVEAGRRHEGAVEIRKGLEAGARVITAGQNRLTNGGPVVIDDSVQPGDEPAAGDTPATEATTTEAAEPEGQAVPEAAAEETTAQGGEETAGAAEAGTPDTTSASSQP